MAFWTHGDKTGASKAKEDEWEGKCNISFDAFGFKQTKNQDLKSIICARPFYKRSKQVPARFEYISKVYRDYKDTKYAPPELLEHFKQFDAIVANGEVEQVEPPNTSENLERLFQQIQKPEPKLFVEEPQQHNNLTALVIKDLIDLAKKKENQENQELILDQLSKFTKKELIRLASFTQVKQSKILNSLINLELASHEGGRKSKRRQRRNRKTRRFQR